MKAKTSLEAFKNMQPKIPNDHQVILSMMSENQPMTYSEISKAIKENALSNKDTVKYYKWSNPVKVMRRLSELVRLEKVEKCEPRICTIAKSKCTTYKLKKN